MGTLPKLYLGKEEGGGVWEEPEGLGTLALCDTQLL